MNNAIDRAVSSIGLTRMLTLAHSALPDAPVVPDTPRASLIDRARLTIVAASRLISRPVPAASNDPVMTQG